MTAIRAAPEPACGDARQAALRNPRLGWARGMALAGLACLAAALAVAALPGAAAQQVPYADIASSGPLTNVFIGADLSCQVLHAADLPNGEFFNQAHRPAACGTFLTLSPGPANQFYTPDQQGHCDPNNPSICGNSDGNAYAGLHTEYTQVSQTGVTGSGTSSDPYSVTTVVGAGSSPVQLRQTDTYIVGQEDYYTYIQVVNSGGAPQEFIVYRAGDCYLGPPADPLDQGYGWVTGDGIACTVTPNNNPANRFIRITWLNPGNGITMTYMEGQYNDVWTTLGQHGPLPNTCVCNTRVDNGLAIAWQGTVPAGGSVWINSSLAFSPGLPPNQNPSVSIQYASGAASCRDSAVRFTGFANDPDGVITFLEWDFGDNSPTSSELNPSHTYAEAGNYHVTLTVKDNRGGQAVADVWVPAAADTNCCPKMANVPNAAVMEGGFVRFFIVAEDLEHDDMTYTVQGELPAGSTFDPDAGYFFWRTAPGDAGVYQFSILGDDGFPHDPACSTTLAHSELGLVRITANIHVTRGPSKVTAEDKDKDGIDDFADNCPGVSNNNQYDSNLDGIGDACQEELEVPADGGSGFAAPPNVADSDGDLIEDVVDNCPGIANSNQKDLDLDRLGDVCDEDMDGDGVVQYTKFQPAKPLILDNCPMVPNADQRDDGQTGIGNACRAEALARPDPLGAQPVDTDASGAGSPDLGWPLHYWLAAFAFVAGIVTVSLVLFVVGRKKS